MLRSWLFFASVPLRIRWEKRAWVMERRMVAPAVWNCGGVRALTPGVF